MHSIDTRCDTSFEHVNSQSSYYRTFTGGKTGNEEWFAISHILGVLSLSKPLAHLPTAVEDVWYLDCIDAINIRRDVQERFVKNGAFAVGQ